jgi:hypothetical protein
MKTSINVKYDYNDNILINDYLETTAHVAVLNGVLKGILGISNQKSHIVFGPYGSGKSYATSLLTGILSKSFRISDIKNLAKRFSAINEELGINIINSTINKTKYIPIIINGYEGDLDTVILNKLSDELSNKNLIKYLPSYSTTVKNIIINWERNFKKTHELFLENLRLQKITIKDFYFGIERNDDSQINWFRDVFRQLSSGQELILKPTGSISSILEEVCIAIADKNYGVFIVYDEFGRYLQNIEGVHINKFMQEMQNLAELANNGVSNLSLLFVSHKPISHYFTYLDNIYRNEFSKVEKRFNQYEIRSDYIAFLNISNSFIAANYKYEYSLDDSIISQTLKFGLFQDTFSDYEVVTKIIKGMYPLHPVSTYLLPKISSVFGQNERTLFTFLNDKSSQGFGYYLSHDAGIYYPDTLVDYFLTSIDDTHSETIREFQIYNQRINRIKFHFGKSRCILPERIFKFIMIWNITSSFEFIGLNEVFISYCLDEDIQEISKYLQELTERKFIRFNKIDNHWEIFEGSDLDINDEITLLNATHPVDNMQLFELLNNHNNHKYIYSDRHNNINEITRFAKLEYVVDSKQIQFLKELADEYIFIHFEIQYLPNNAINAYSNYPLNKIKTVLTRMYYLEYIQHTQHYHLNYPNLEAELDYEINLCKNTLIDFYAHILESCSFEVDEQKYEFRKYSDLSNFLSNRFDEKYQNSILISNDQINMFVLTTIQHNAIKTVFSRFLQSNGLVEKLDFQTNQPANLIFYSVLKNVKNNRNFNNYTNLSIAINSFMVKNPNGRIIDIISILTKPPFGIRPHVAILVAVREIHEKWRDMLLFKNGLFIANIGSDELFDTMLAEWKTDYFSQVFESDSNLSDTTGYTMYSFSIFDNKNRKYLESLEKLFDSSSNNVSNKSLSIRVCSSMYNWYINLPVITQQGEKLGVSDYSFLNIIKKSRINPQGAIDNLITFTDNIEDIYQFKNDIENHYHNYIDQIEKEIRKELAIHDEKSWIEQHDLIEIKTNKVVSMISKGKGLIESFASYIDNIEVEKWTKSSFINLKKYILDEYYKSTKNIKFNTIYINGKEIAVQDVSLSSKGSLTLDNIESTIKATNRFITQAELEKIILILLERYVK